ncbi:FUSC family protein [Streptomyces sp. NPDC001665]
MTADTARAVVVRRGVRVAFSAAAGFYPLLHAVDRPVAALYALFGPVALGLLSAVPGSGRQKATVMLCALPPALVLASLGTLLAVNTWAAAGGMLVVGFLLAFAAIGGPRPAGAGPGLQLFYILACFPPYDPGSLADRLIGLTAGVLLLVASEALLMPERPVPSYRRRLAEALRTAADEAASPGRVPPATLRAAGERLRPSTLPPAEQPASAGRTDRALDQAGRSVRRLLNQLATLAEEPATPTDPASAELLARVAVVCTGCAYFLRTGKRAPVAGSLETAMRAFGAERVRLTAGPPGLVPPIAVLRRQSRILALAESARIVEVTTDIAGHGRPVGPAVPRDQFWYAELSTPALWARRILGNITLRSVLFQNAVRTALGLAAARLVAGTLDLAHGFWVLLAVLTLGRTTVGATWQAVRRAVAGNVVGALAAGALLIGLGTHTDVYAALLVPAMLTAFCLGPQLGIAWAQAGFTLVVATVFAQIAPVTWRLSEARMVDVLTGSAVGLLCGLLAWPAGARREVRRTMAALLHSCGGLVPATARVLMIPAPGARTPAPVLPSLHRLRLAEAAYAQYRSETPDLPARTGTDWHAVLIVASHVILGAHRLPHLGLPQTAEPTGCPAAWARTTAAGLEAEADRVAALVGGGAPAPARPPAPAPADYPPAALSVDLEVWLTSLGHQLAHIDSTARNGERSGHADG